MKKCKQIFQKSNLIIFLLVTLLAGIGLTQEFLSKDPVWDWSVGVFFAPWVLFLLFLAADGIIVSKKIRGVLRRKAVRRILEWVLVFMLILGVLGGAFFLELAREKEIVLLGLLLLTVYLLVCKTSGRAAAFGALILTGGMLVLRNEYFPLYQMPALPFSFALDESYWSLWLVSPIDGILGFFHKLQDFFLVGKSLEYGYGILSLLIMAMAQAFVLFFRKKDRCFLPVYFLNILFIIELAFEKQIGSDLVSMILLIIFASGLFGSTYDALLESKYKKEKINEKYEEALAKSQVVMQGPVEVKDILEETIAVTTEEAFAEKEKATETEKEEKEEEEEEEEEEKEKAVATEKMADAAEFQELREKLEQMQLQLESQRLRIARLEAVLKEQRLLAKKRERRLRKELAIARNQANGEKIRR